MYGLNSIKNDKDSNIRQKAKPTVMVVDDEVSVLKSTEIILKEEGYQTELCSTGREAIDKFNKDINTVVLDISMPDLTGLQVFEKIKAKNPYVPLIFHTGVVTQREEISKIRRKFRPHAYVLKGSDPEQLLDTVAGAIESYEKIIKLDKMKDNIIRDVSHELKSPLAQLRVALELWAKEINGGSKYKDKLELFNSIIKESVRRLHKTIESVLDLSVLESSCVKYRTEHLNLNELIQQLAAGSRLIAEKKNLSLVVKVPDKLPDILGDEVEISRVISNLIDNSVKYAEFGQIIVSAVRRGNEIEIAVKDAGVGISLAKNHYNKLFDRFFQEDTTTAGCGVGLAICKKIVEAHGGRIWAESEGKGKGSTFKFTLLLNKE
jgi:signal transduction histidine kinase